MKGGKNLEEWVDRLLALATSSSRDLGRTAADSWWILLGRVFTDDSFQPIRFSFTVYPVLKHQLKTHQGDTPDLSEASLATVKMLYPQRLFNLALGKIRKAVDENSKKGSYFIFLRNNWFT